jgi:uncharacterized membrane protein
MKSLIIGIILLALAVFSMLPMGLGWWPNVVQFLRGFVPVAVIIIGLVVVFVGCADIKDRITAKKEKVKNDE